MICSFKLQLGRARAEGDGHGVSVDTGRVGRAWSVEPSGLATVRLLRAGGEPWMDGPAFGCDWSLRGLLAPQEEAELVRLEGRTRTDLDFTSDHIEVTGVFRYARTGFDVRHTSWIYPDAPGIRTQLALQPLRAFDPEELPSFLGGCRSERLAVDAADSRLFAAGYYTDTQHRNYDHTPILRTREWPAGRHGCLPVDWANLVCLERGGEGLALVKESHKTVNHDGVDTGAFLVGPDRVEVTGLGLTPVRYGGGFWADNLDRWRECWATWAVLYNAADGETARQLAVKRMDRCRFPFRPRRDRWITANTWGSGGAGEGSRSAAEEANVLRELGVAAELGIEIVQIDDGWQTEPEDPEPVAGDKAWRPSPARWPHGWAKVREAAGRLGVDLGLWLPWYVDGEKIARNVEQAGFRRLKLDYMDLRGPHDIERIRGKVRGLIDRFGPGLGINWDATEHAARMGYYFGRDHGNVYLANRPAGPPPSRRLNHVRYIPRLVLRDAWHLAHYLNLNQFQLPVQNIERVVCDLTNSGEYPHDYCFAIAMMGVPLFFQETRHYAREARRELREMIALYKRHRDAILAGTVFPVGDEPCDAAWCGFQSHRPRENAGHLTVFRELRNAHEVRAMPLAFAAGRGVNLTDLRTGESSTCAAGPDGEVELRLEAAPSFGFYEYRLL